MKITCEHCGCGIDIDKDEKCPNCGAPYSDNKEYKELQDYHKKNKEYNLKERELSLKHKEMVSDLIQKNTKGQKAALAVGLIIFIAIFGTVVFNILKFNDSPIVNRPVTASYNEFAATSSYEIKVDEVGKIEVDDSIWGTFFKPTEGHSYYKFHVLFKQKDNELNNLNSIQLTYTDNNGNEDIMAKKMDLSTDLNSFAKEKMTYSGYVTFEIPDYVNDVNIKFKNATVEIKDFKGNIAQ